MKPLLVLVEIDFSVYKKAVKKSQQILTALFITLLTHYFCFFKNSTPVSGKSVNTPVAPDLFNNASYI